MRTGTSDQSRYLFKQGGTMLSIQGLIIMFMFGVAVTMLVSAMWLGYTEYKLKQRDNKDRLSQELLREIFRKDDDEL